MNELIEVDMEERKGTLMGLLVKPWLLSLGIVSLFWTVFTYPTVGAFFLLFSLSFLLSLLYVLVLLALLDASKIVSYKGLIIGQIAAFLGTILILTIVLWEMRSLLFIPAIYFTVGLFFQWLMYRRKGKKSLASIAKTMEQVTEYN